MEPYIQISKINDFIFCPYSVYLHGVYENFSQKVYHEEVQIIGKISHETIEEKRYTTSKWILQGIDVYCEKYNLAGKIDIFDIELGFLIERKYKVKKVYDGYKYQLYAQMFCLKEIGYEVKKLFIHSLSDNKRYNIILPDKNEIAKFEALIKEINNYQAEQKVLKNLSKCARCVYKPLCH